MRAPDGRTFYLRQGDRLPSISGVICQGSARVNLTGASVALKIRRSDLSAAAVSRTATVASGTLGKVSYLWAAADVETPGEYLMEWVVTFAGGTIATYPADGHVRLVVGEAL